MILLLFGAKIRGTDYVALTDQILDAGSLILANKTDVILILGSIFSQIALIFVFSLPSVLFCLRSGEIPDFLILVYKKDIILISSSIQHPLSCEQWHKRLL
ncbi:hypothetical protein D1BOALGB6SA_1165 [Olavius sp. associated proteobacterium Delta 1]|nr:hypothetical protein D1BOALGB6SA_1165 [Olavius sp. associated proteobacterium Delta 1]